MIRLAVTNVIRQRIQGFAYARFGGMGRHVGFIQKHDPATWIAAGFAEPGAYALEQAVAVLVPGDELIDVADGPQTRVETLRPSTVSGIPEIFRRLAGLGVAVIHDLPPSCPLCHATKRICCHLIRARRSTP